MTVPIKDLVEIVKMETYFCRFQDGNLIYKVYNPVTEKFYEYDIPITDCKGAIMYEIAKAIYHMRWIRKAINTNMFREIIE